jgi:transglutaminase-like putative cysteine protease
MTDPADYCSPGTFIDSDHQAIVALARDLATPETTDAARAVSLYYWVRDEIRYNPYAVSANPGDYRASQTLAAGESWCVPKAILLAALCRAVGLPARPGFADVRNHLSTARMRELMQTDLF